MKFTIERDKILKTWQKISSVLVARPTMPILKNILITVNKDNLILTGTDLEIEIMASIKLEKQYELSSTTIPARKFLEICRSLPEKADITITLQANRILISSNRSRFVLSVLSAEYFPNVEEWKSELDFVIPIGTLKFLIEKTQFSMANQDVRYALNGIMLECSQNELRTIATDGHRLALCSIFIEKKLPDYSIIIPRKGIIELLRLLENNATLIKIQMCKNKIRIYINNFIFTSKLIDGIFPNYRRVLIEKPNKIISINCDVLKKSLTRVAILSHEKFRSIRILITNNQMTITANNSQQEEAEEILEIDYHGNELEFGVNVNYILDVLNVLKCDFINLLLIDSTSSLQIETVNNDSKTIYVIMPIRL